MKFFLIILPFISGYLDSLKLSQISSLRQCLAKKSANSQVSCDIYIWDFLEGSSKAIYEIFEFHETEKRVTSPLVIFPAVLSGTFRFLASSSFDDGTTANRARLDFKYREGHGSWIPLTNNINEYLQFSGPRPFKFHSVETRGHLNENRYTQTYRVQYTLDGNTWNWYKNGLIFNGNTNNINGVNNTFEPFVARAVRIWPITFTGSISLRAEMYVSEILYDAQPPKRVPTIKAIQSGFNVVMSTIYEPLYGNDCFTVNFRTNNINKAWCAATNSLDQVVIISAPVHVRWHQIVIQGKSKTTERGQYIKII